MLRHRQRDSKYNEGPWEPLQLQMIVRLGRSLLDLGVMDVLVGTHGGVKSAVYGRSYVLRECFW